MQKITEIRQQGTIQSPPTEPPAVPGSDPLKASYEAYWHERKQMMESLRAIPELKSRFYKALGIYLLRRFLWSFGFFPVFIAFWLPLVLSHFNPVAAVGSILPSLQNFVNANPEVQAATMETLFIAWFSIGFIFAVFDFVLTPFKSPYEYEVDVHMKAWEQLRNEKKFDESSPQT